MHIQESIFIFLDHRRNIRNISHASYQLYTRLLDQWQQWRDRAGLSPQLGDVTIEDFRGFIGWLTSKGRAPSTIDTYRRCLRAYWRFLAAEGLLTDVQLTFWGNNRIPRPLGVDPPPRPYYSADDFEQLLARAGDGNDEESARNRAILLLLWESGMRVSEVCSLTDGATQLKQRRATIIGKGRKHGYVFWGSRTDAAIRRYLFLRRGHRGGDAPLFRGISSRNQGGAMTANAVRIVIKKLGKGLFPKGAPVHALRHSFAHRAIEEGLEISQVQQLMRHSDIGSTLRYLGEQPDKLQALHQKVLGIHEPFATQKKKRKNGSSAS